MVGLTSNLPWSETGAGAPGEWPDAQKQGMLTPTRRFLSLPLAGVIKLSFVLPDLKL